MMLNEHLKQSTSTVERPRRHRCVIRVRLPLNIQKHEERPPGTECFSKYESPFSSYPLLRSRPNALNFPEHTQDIPTLNRPAASVLGSSISSSSSLSIPSSTTPVTHPSSLYVHTDAQKTFTPNLRELNYIATAHALNPKKSICQYEIPGGGVCRDAKCKDIHLSRIQATDGRVEPTDADTASFLSRSLEIKLNKISSALKQVRAEHPTITLEERVARALQLSIHPT
ncbi:hypothetical protein BDZ89DRAFT_325132 [Hymenopellis radicata]|nr:hypothetical protein BDZ89DRAFT_325132 [Hymenopellis radicata]